MSTCVCARACVCVRAYVRVRACVYMDVHVLFLLNDILRLV